MAEEQKQSSEKDVAFYSTLVGAWVDNKMELDRSLLTLSTGGLGLFITLLSTEQLKENLALSLFACACIFFTATIILCLFIFKRNTTYLKNVVGGYQGNDVVLTWLDCLNMLSFTLAIIFSALIGLTMIIKHITC